VNPYELERLAAERMADHLREAEAHRARDGRRLTVVVAGALRGVADRLDGGHGDARRLGTARALD
jgi:hypothetical protein